MTLPANDAQDDSDLSAAIELFLNEIEKLHLWPQAALSQYHETRGLGMPYVSCPAHLVPAGSDPSIYIVLVSDELYGVVVSKDVPRMFHRRWVPYRVLHFILLFLSFYASLAIGLALGIGIESSAIAGLATGVAFIALFWLINRYLPVLVFRSVRMHVEKGHSVLLPQFISEAVERTSKAEKQAAARASRHMAAGNVAGTIVGQLVEAFAGKLVAKPIEMLASKLTEMGLDGRFKESVGNPPSEVTR